MLAQTRNAKKTSLTIFARLFSYTKHSLNAQQSANQPPQ
jgi:hypothetical protein